MTTTIQQQTAVVIVLRGGDVGIVANGTWFAMEGVCHYLAFLMDSRPQQVLPYVRMDDTVERHHTEEDTEFAAAQQIAAVVLVDGSEQQYQRLRNVIDRETTAAQMAQNN